MALIMKPKTFASNAVAIAADVNSDFDTIYNDYNGNITYANLSPNAAIRDTQLQNITTGGKVNISALTATSQAAGDILYASSASSYARLGKGTASQFLKMKSDATIPEWSTNLWSDMPAGSVVQVVNYQTGATATGSASIPVDDTIPQNTEGIEVMTLAITPKSATNELKIDVQIVVGMPSGNGPFSIIALFQDSTAGALAASADSYADGNTTPTTHCTKLTHYMTSGTTSATTFKVRITLPSSGIFNGFTGARLFGGVCASSITITEIKV